MTVVAPVVDSEHPWLGLLSFQEDHRRYFFGREHEVADFYERVRRNRLTVLYGPSGLGKTSLLQAGLCPRLREGDWLPVLIRLRYPSPEDGAGDQPPRLLTQVVAALAAALGGAELPVPGVLETSPVESLWRLFHDIELGLCGAGKSRVVLLFDQFEEIFTLGEDEMRARDDAVALRDALADLVENRPPPTLARQLELQPEFAEQFDFESDNCRVALVLREDYLARLERWRRALPSLTRNRMELRLLDGPRAFSAVVKPGQLGGRQIIDEVVGANIVRVVAGAEEDVPLDEITAVPPLLSLLCRELNERRLSTNPPATQINSELLASSKGDILLSYYDDCFAEMPDAVRDTIEDLLLSPAGYRENPSSDALLAELQRRGVDQPLSAIQTLEASRLITTEERGGVRRVELTHDVLAPLVLASRDARQEREAREAAERDTEKVRAERARLRKFAFAMTALAAIAVLFLAITWIVLGQKRLAQQQLRVVARSSWSIARDKAGKQGERGIAFAYLAYGLRNDPSSTEGWLLAQYQLAFGGILPPTNQISLPSSGFYPALSPDGTALAQSDPKLGLRVYNSKDGTLRLEVPFPPGAKKHSAPIFSPDSKRIIISWEKADGGPSRSHFQLWDLEGKKVILDHEPESAAIDVSKVVFRPDGGELAFPARGEVIGIDTATGKERSLEKGKGRSQYDDVNIVYSSDSRKFVTWARSRWRLFDTATLHVIGDTLGSGFDEPIAVEFRRNGADLLVALGTGQLLCIDAATGIVRSRSAAPCLSKDTSGKCLTYFNGYGLVKVMPIGDRILILGATQPKEKEPAPTRADYRLVRFGEFDESAGEGSVRIEGRPPWVVEFGENGRLLAIEAGQGIDVYDLHLSRKIATLLDSADLLEFRFISNTRQIIGVDAEGRTRTWNLDWSITPLATIVGIFPQGQGADAPVGYALSGNDIDLIRPGTAEIVTRIEAYRSRPDVVYSPDASEFVTAARQGQLARIWSGNNGKMICYLESSDREQLRDFLFAMDGRRLCARTQRKVDPDALLVWDASTGKLLFQGGQETAKDEGPSSAPAISPDGRLLAAIFGEQHLHLWDIDSRQERWHYNDENAELKGEIAFSSDSKRLWAQRRSTLLLVECDSGKTIVPNGSANMQQVDPSGNAIAVDGVLKKFPSLDRITDLEEAGSDRNSTYVFSEDGNWIAQNRQEKGNEGPDQRIDFCSVWKRDTGELVAHFPNFVAATSINTGGPGKLVLEIDGVSYPFWLPTADVPGWVSDWLEYWGGYRINPSGRPVRLTPKEMADRLAKVRNAPPDTSPFAVLRNWMFAPMEKRTVSPWNLTPARVFADNLLSPSAADADVATVAMLAPQHPLIDLALAERTYDDGAARVALSKVEANLVELKRGSAFLLKQEKNEVALEWLDRALVLEPRDAAPLKAKSEALDRLGRKDESLAALRQALALDATHRSWREEFARQAATQGLLQETITAYEDLLRENQGDDSLHYTYGVALGELEDNTRALVHLREAERIQLERDGKAAPKVSLGLAAVEWSLDHKGEAIRLYLDEISESSSSIVPSILRKRQGTTKLNGKLKLVRRASFDKLVTALEDNDGQEITEHFARAAEETAEAAVSAEDDAEADCLIEEVLQRAEKIARTSERRYGIGAPATERVANALRIRGRHREAADQYEAAGSYNVPKAAESLVKAAAELREVGGQENLERALDLCERALEIRKDFLEAVVEMSYLHEELGNRFAAIRALSLASEQTDKSSDVSALHEAMWQAARLEERAKSFEDSQAFSFFKRAEELSPGDTNVLNIKAWCLYYYGESREARDLWKRIEARLEAAKEAPNARVCGGLALAYDSLDDTANARLYYLQAVDGDDDLADPEKLKNDYYWKDKRVSEAWKHLRSRLIAEDQLSTAALVKQADKTWYMDKKEAVRLLEHRLETLPQNWSLLANLGMLEKRAKRWDKALQRYRQATTSPEATPERKALGFRRIAEIYANEVNPPKYDEALASLGEALRADPSDEFALNQRGEIFLKTGRFEEALRAYEQAAGLDPSYNDYAASAAYAAAFAKNREAAHRWLTRATLSEPSPRYAGWTALALGEYDKAVGFGRDGIKLARTKGVGLTGSAVILALGHKALGQGDAAREAYYVAAGASSNLSLVEAEKEWDIPVPFAANWKDLLTGLSPDERLSPEHFAVRAWRNRHVGTPKARADGLELMAEAMRRSNSKDPDILVQQAALLDSEGRTEEASKLYEQAAALSGGTILPERLAEAAATLVACVPPALAPAHRALDRALEGSPNSIRVLRERVWLWCVEGKRKEAAALAITLSARNELTADDRAALAYQFLYLGDTSRATQLIETAAKASPDSDPVPEWQGWISFNMLDDAKALVAFGQIAEETPDDSPSATDTVLICSILRLSLENNSVGAVEVFRRLAEKWPAYRLPNVFLQPNWTSRERQVLTAIQKQALAP